MSQLRKQLKKYEITSGFYDFENFLNRLVFRLIPDPKGNKIQGVVSIALMFSAISQSDKWTNIINVLKIGRENNDLSTYKLYQLIFDSLYIPYFLETIRKKNLETLEDFKRYFFRIRPFAMEIDSKPDLTEVFKFLRKFDKYKGYSDYKLFNFSEISLEDEGIVSLPENFGYLINLRKLNLYINILTSLPNSFGNLVNLEELLLSNNKLEILPPNFVDLSHLKELTLYDNQLTNLPENFGDLKNLEYFTMASNKIISLPESFTKLTKLSFLSLSYNNLSILPENFGNLINLQTLWLDNNKIKELPQSFEYLENLQHLYLNRNPLGNDVREVLEALVNTNSKIVVLTTDEFDFRKELNRNKRKERAPGRITVKAITYD